MFRRHLLPIAGVSAAVLLAFWYSHSPGRKAPPLGPKSLHEAGQIARNLGLHCRSDALDGAVLIRLVISSNPLTYERANELHFGNPGHPCWRDTVAASTPRDAYPYLADDVHGVVWGEVFLYGDPVLIQKLTAAEPAGPHASISEESARKNGSPGVHD
jgi:hypothetical protein